MVLLLQVTPDIKHYRKKNEKTKQCVRITHPPLTLRSPSFLQWVYYEVGFLVCTTLGVLLLVVTPIIGACFCVCRCCENCGGEMHQRQRKNADCQRGFFTASLVATSVLIM